MSTEFAGCSNDIEDDNISYDDEDELKVYETICDGKQIFSFTLNVKKG